MKVLTRLSTVTSTDKTCARLHLICGLLMTPYMRMNDTLTPFWCLQIVLLSLLYAAVKGCVFRPS